VEQFNNELRRFVSSVFNFVVSHRTGCLRLASDFHHLTTSSKNTIIIRRKLRMIAGKMAVLKNILHY